MSDSTHIDILEKHLFPTLRTVAPERKDDLFATINGLGLTFIFDRTQDRILFASNLSEKRITVGVRCLERLWALAYGYFVLFDALRIAKLKDITTRSVPINGNPTLEAAAGLITWATSVDWQIKNEGETRIDPLPPWPDQSLRPVANPSKGSNEQVADELFLSALGYILHHELAHLKLGHVGCKGVQSIIQEKDADREAASWLLDDLDQWDTRFVKRGFGIALAACWLAAVDVHAGPLMDGSHPPGYDRLYQVLERHVSDPMHPIWAFSAMILEMHLDARKAQYAADRETESYKDAVNYYCDVISRLPNR